MFNRTKTEDLLKQMIGKTITKVLVESDKTAMHFVCDEGTFTFHHEQDCCESVWIEDITGDVADLEGTPMLNAEEVSGSIPADYEHSNDSCTWTFYKFATIKGYVDVRWLGESNGYYSESVDVEFVPVPKDGGQIPTPGNVLSLGELLRKKLRPEPSAEAKRIEMMRGELQQLIIDLPDRHVDALFLHTVNLVEDTNAQPK